MGSSHKELYTNQIKNSICKIKLNNNDKGIGFFCFIPFPTNNNLLTILITTNHILNKKDISNGNTINISLDKDKNKYSILIDDSRKTYTNEKYDITFIEIKNNDGIDQNLFLHIDLGIYENNPDKQYNKKVIYLLNYPDGKKNNYFKGQFKNISEDKFVQTKIKLLDVQ